MPRTGACHVARRIHAQLSHCLRDAVCFSLQAQRHVGCRLSWLGLWALDVTSIHCLCWPTMDTSRTRTRSIDLFIAVAIQLTTVARCLQCGFAPLLFPLTSELARRVKPHLETKVHTRGLARGLPATMLPRSGAGGLQLVCLSLASRLAATTSSGLCFRRHDNAGHFSWSPSLAAPVSGGHWLCSTLLFSV